MAIEQINILKDLDFTKQLTFAFLTCKRVYPNYVYFTEKFNFGDVNIISESIDLIYHSIFNPKRIDKQKIENILNSIYVNTPNTNDFTSFYATITMYSCGVVYESVNLLRKTDTDRILRAISTMITDAIDCFIQERDDMDYSEENFEQKIFNDSLMQTELGIQKGIISYLEKVDHIEQSDINTLLQLQEIKKSSLII
ncbi:MAG TPA: DUF416 family protein [Flavisolibacter sp.]|nr:DUF416 family protein [Flavisolibacter sp.]